MVIYADGADLATMARMAQERSVLGFTTNPTLLKKSGITNYKEFARRVLHIAQNLPVSFEVLAGSMDGMTTQAREIASWGRNVFVKIPVFTVSGAFAGPVISRLSEEGVQLNVTAVMTDEQVEMVLDVLKSQGNIISIFAGRVADTGVDPEVVIRSAVSIVNGKQQILWASAREVFNVRQAERAGADIITLTAELIEKMKSFGRDLNEYSVATARQFARDAEGISL